MGSTDEAIEIDVLERRLLSGSVTNRYNEAEEDTILHTASFYEMEEKYVKYQTVQWILYSLLLMLAWGIGALMLLYLPIRRHILRSDFRSRKLYVTSNAIVYEVTRPVVFPCFGVLTKEKHVVLASVADIVVEQGYLQSFFGIFSVRIKNTGVRRPPSDDVQILGISEPGAFRKAVLMHLSNTRSDILSKQIYMSEDPHTLGSGPSTSWVPPPGDIILQKLEEIGNSVKKMQALIEKKFQAPELSD
ncbi:uncharacterized protein LOC122002618 [Zingiber officinale]|uniref:DUF7642 domain-containing protein n=1 Tax=Zingiber officinale TaxID=94328 RepID=A0A8J5G8P5_ZINOF|nr:uncharacterized protein LOC122002618 [Zingiber officinale]XP_042413780.1 uncharacterized protein LOC122002618 [Zingiber officinale]KAG6494050.1 hypothetical protein ZIOFF_049068 [Zingiber officinale]